MNKLDNLILEAYKEVLNEMPKGATLKVKDIPQAMIDRLEKQYGPVDKKDDFFSKNMDTYFKFTGRNKTTGSVEHKIIQLPSFFKMYEHPDCRHVKSGGRLVLLPPLRQAYGFLLVLDIQKKPYNTGRA